MAPKAKISVKEQERLINLVKAQEIVYTAVNNNNFYNDRLNAWENIGKNMKPSKSGEFFHFSDWQRFLFSHRPKFLLFNVIIV